jgi:hypothetical protein
VFAVAEEAAVLADPFDVALFAVVEVGDFCFLPVVGEAEGVYFEGNAFDAHAFAAEDAETLLEGSELAVYY